MIGGTAWDFANAGRVPRGSLDLLVIEEAGQFCLANTIAVASAAKNLLLLGDPQQLPQVSQGTHPEPVDTSALGWLVDGRHTLPAELGYFLDRSYRMHPDVCAAGVAAVLRRPAAVRTASVPGRAHSTGMRPGCGSLTVDHDGNSTDSPEEADAIVAEIAEPARFDMDRRVRRRDRSTQDDVLVVDPVQRAGGAAARAARRAGLDGVRAGTVDKFQGQQAPVVFVSMTASSIDDVPRGISFLLNRNRLNVAVSRAKYLSVIVRSPLLTEYLPGTPDRLIELGAFLSLAPCDTPSG